MLELLVDTAEQYQRELECDRELYQVIALDAKGIKQIRSSANRAMRLLAEASEVATKESPAAAKPSPSKQTSAKPKTRAETDAVAHQPGPAQR